MRNRHTGTTRARWLAGTVMVPALALSLGACDSLLDSKDPDIALPEDVLFDTLSIPAIRAGAIGDFSVAFSNGGSDGLTTLTGLMSDEFFHSGTFNTRAQIDRRSMFRTNGTVEDWYLDLHQARVAAEEGAAALASLAPQGASAINNVRTGRAELLSLAGYIYVFFGENFCGAVPYSRLTEADTVAFGAPQTRAQTLQRAVDSFDEALTIAQTITRAADRDAQVNLALVGKARALLDLGRFDEAAEVAEQVRTGFTYFVEASDNTFRQFNAIYELSWIEGRWSVANQEGSDLVNGVTVPGEGLPYIEDFLAGDSRVPVSFDLVGDSFDGDTPLYVDLKYADYGAFTVLADWVEAQLIIAEAALQNGDQETFLETHNLLRENAVAILEERIFDPDFIPEPLAPLTIPAGTTQAELVDLHFKERAYWLWLTGHRLNDLRRLVAQYGREATDVYPSENYHKGGSYGSDLVFPVPASEDNNPLFSQGQCVTTSPT